MRSEEDDWKQEIKWKWTAFCPFTPTKHPQQMFLGQHFNFPKTTALLTERIPHLQSISLHWDMTIYSGFSKADQKSPVFCKSKGNVGKTPEIPPVCQSNNRLKLKLQDNTYASFPTTSTSHWKFLSEFSKLMCSVLLRSNWRRKACSCFITTHAWKCAHLN